jgi:hypothetical protein
VPYDLDCADIGYQTVLVVGVDVCGFGGTRWDRLRVKQAQGLYPVLVPVESAFPREYRRSSSAASSSREALHRRSGRGTAQPGEDDTVDRLVALAAAASPVVVKAGPFT